MKCPNCGSENVHETQLHECPYPIGGTPMRCSDCYHTWCEGSIPIVDEDNKVLMIMTGPLAQAWIKAKQKNRADN